MSDDDFYYRRKPHQSLVRKRGLSLEARGAADTYEDEMHTRDGTLPDERAPKGMAWHQTVLGVRNGRTVNRLVAELLEAGWLIRLNDGRLTNADVQRERAYRAKRQRGSGEGGGGAPKVVQLTLIDGGKAEDRPQRPEDKPVSDRGRKSHSGGNRVSKRRITPDVGRKAQRNQWLASHSIERVDHESVVAVPFVVARARGDPFVAA